MLGKGEQGWLYRQPHTHISLSLAGHPLDTPSCYPAGTLGPLPGRSWVEEELLPHHIDTCRNPKEAVSVILRSSYGYGNMVTF